MASPASAAVRVEKHVQLYRASTKHRSKMRPCCKWHLPVGANGCRKWEIAESRRERAACGGLLFELHFAACPSGVGWLVTS
eukprot:51675-Prymnesium_polylepis.1